MQILSFHVEFLFRSPPDSGNRGFELMVTIPIFLRPLEATSVLLASFLHLQGGIPRLGINYGKMDVCVNRPKD
jgi:hypothetical protein